MNSPEFRAAAAASTRSSAGRWRRPWLWVGLIALLGLIVWWQSGSEAPVEAAGRPGAQNVPVRVATVERASLPVYLSALGTVTPLNTVTVRSRVDGQLVEIGAREGERVDAGELLAQIDPRPYQVALAQAEGQQQQNRALLENARNTLETYQGLWEQDSIARQELDDQAALVRQYEGTVLMDQARVDEARLQLSFTRITAPISGRLGLRSVDAGNLVSTGDAAGLMTLTQMDPIAVVFNLPEGDLPALLARVREAGENGESGEALIVEAWNRDSSVQLATGRLRTIDNQIDTATGTIRLKALFENDDLSLFPNQFVNVKLRLNTLEDVAVVPTAAIQHGSVGPYVYVLDGDTAALRTVAPGGESGRRTAIIEGLQANDRVVLEGLEKLRDGATVVVVAEEPGAAATVQQSSPLETGAGDDA